jgi:fatty-acyl-CoA synthase
VGKPLSYVMATPARPDDADNPLRIVFGNEGNEGDIAAFAERFGCRVVDGFGSTENAVVISRTEGTPPGSLGQPAPGVAVYDPETSTECPRAVLDDTGAVLNLDECVGELVNTTGTGQFAGYYNDDAATAARMRGGMYWSGDLAYRDADGWVYFAGRTADWLRVDGENADRTDPAAPPGDLRGRRVRRPGPAFRRPAGRCPGDDTPPHRT